MKAKKLLEGDNLSKLVLALSGRGDPIDNEQLRQKFHARNPRFADLARIAQSGARGIFGVPDAEMLRDWLIEMGHPGVQVSEGVEEPMLGRPSDHPSHPNQDFSIYEYIERFLKL